ncbi:sigma-54-dependent transcriptional regulator [Tautonia plasticadhaerens]|nr:sigma-54 dependent transcriptional regulator [Tautonia plasticadhaerens]
MNIIIVDDEANIRRTLRVALEAAGHGVREAASGAEALAELGRRPCDAALVDLRLGGESGLDLIGPLREHAPRLAVVVITAHASIGSAVEAMRRGADDYLPKPFTPAEVRAVLDRVARQRGLRDRVEALEDLVRREVPEAELDARDPAMARVLELARRVAPTDAAVLLRGESGTGKGVLARALHSWGGRAGGPFVTVSCPSLGAELLESELFGHVKGAFTGAVRDTVGKVAAAEGGTLFLDEVGDLPVALQPKLLRFLQGKRYERVGEAAERQADVRLIAATNRDLEAMVAAGTFREDLLYRLNVLEVALPPLRERSDRLELADRMLAFFAGQTGRRLSGFTAEAREAIGRHPWPGNLRELRNAVERAAILAEGPEVGLADLPGRVARGPAGPGVSNAVEVGGPVTLEELEVEHIRQVLAASASLEEAAQVLGVDPSTLFRRRRKHGL